MYKSIPIVINHVKSIKSPQMNKMTTELIMKQDKFLCDKLSYILTPETKKYLELRKEMDEEINKNLHKDNRQLPK